MSSVLHRNFSASLPVAIKGDGVYIVDAEGKRYIDASGGAAVSCLGHNHPAIIEAVRAQLDALEFVHTSFFTNEPSEKLAAKLISRAPEGFGAGRVAFAGSGSEAMEIALKLARQYFVEIGQPQRSHFIARRMSYHGNTLGALSVGGHMQRRKIYEPLLFSASHVSPAYAYRFKAEGETDEAYLDRLITELEAEFERVGPDNVAAFVAEPIVGATLGCVPAVNGYFKRVREVCDRYGALLIADEVMCGMGRTGPLFAMTAEDAVPDIITIAKGLGAGYQPLGAAMAHERVVNGLAGGSGTLANGHTYMSHPVACAAGLAVIETIERDKLGENVAARGEQLESALRQRFGQHAHVGDIRGRGLFWALELVADRTTKAPFPVEKSLSARVKAAALARGLVCYPSSGTADGVNGDHVLLAPPYTVASDEIALIVERLDGALRDALA